MVIMNQTKAMVLTMPNNIWRILVYTGVPMRMFSLKFGPKQFNCTLSTKSVEGLPEEELRNWPLKEKPTMPNKLDKKIALIPTTPIVNLPPPPARL